MESLLLLFILVCGGGDKMHHTCFAKRKFLLFFMYSYADGKKMEGPTYVPT